MRQRKKGKLESYWPTIPADVRQELILDSGICECFRELRMDVPMHGERFWVEMAQMRGMGLNDDALNLQALRRHGGDIAAAAQDVRRQQGDN